MGPCVKRVLGKHVYKLPFLHDIGKLHPGFQAKGWPSGLWRGPVCGHLREGWAFLLLAAKRPEHPFHETMRHIMGWGEAVGQLVGAMMAHHGRPVAPPSDPTLHSWQSLPHYDWRNEARSMDDALRCWFTGAFESGGEQLPNTSRFHHAVAGFVSLADWIGSDTAFFPFTEPFSPAYDVIAHDSAARSLRAIGVDIGALAGRSAPSFSKLTGFPEPNPAQKAVGNLGSGPRLVILEAETGSGKTEAALWRFTQLVASTLPYQRVRQLGSFMVALTRRCAACSVRRRLRLCWRSPVCCVRGSSQANDCPIGE